jgi:hypothetical protein
VKRCHFHFLTAGCLIFLLFFSGCYYGRQPFAAPTMLPGTDKDMMTAGYWITRHPSPDSLILSSYQIQVLNHHIEKDLKTILDITRVEQPFTDKEIADALRKDIARLRSTSRYLSSGRAVSSAFYDRMIRDMDIGGLEATIYPAYGIITCLTDQRVLPTTERLFARPSDVDFDELQNNALNMGTPVLIIHRTLDGQWTYVRAPDSAGWVKSDRIARCTRFKLESYVNSDAFVVTTLPKTDIYLNPEQTHSETSVQMGTRLPLIPTDDNMFHVQVPARDADGYLVTRQGYIPGSSANVGYLPYTARNILYQAFEMLNTPYGWGGMYGEQDCSRFVQEVFATVGITFPRNSADQAVVGDLLGEFTPATSPADRNSVLLDKATGGETLLYMKGHIMLYLGKVDNVPYVIHDVWGYHAHVSGSDRVYKIGRVAVTDLTLGTGSRGGSLLDALRSVRIIH